MVTQVIMPKLAANVEEATVGQWFKREGERVARNEVLFEAITDKAAVEVRAEGEGVLRTVYAAENSVVPVGQVIAVIAEPDEELPEVQAAPPARPRPALSRSVKASFGARRLAKQLGLDLTTVAPSRPDGRITEDDVRRAAEEAAAGVPARKTLRLGPLKRALVEHLTRVARDVPAPLMSVEVDFSAVEAALPALREAAGLPVYPRDVLTYAAARLLPEHPLLNACFQETGIVLYDPVHVGLAFDVPREDAVLVPVVRDADQKDVAAIARETADLARRLQAQELGPADFADATFTVSDQSELGIDLFVPILAERQSAMVALSAIRRRPVVRKDSVIAAPVANLAVAFDHRVLNGATAARFLCALRDAIEDFHPAG